MPFHTGKYDVFVMLGHPKATPPWSWPVWSKLVESLDPIIHAARGKAGLRCDQFQADRKSVKFGRIAWNDDGHKKWTHGSPRTRAASWRFFSLQVWAPSWTICERDDLAPDVFIGIFNEGFHEPDSAFNPVILFAVSTALAKGIAAEMKQALTEMARLTKALLIGYRRRPWGVSVGNIGFTDSIQDLCVSGLFKPGLRRKVGFDLFAARWTPVRQHRSGLLLPSPYVD